MGLMAHVFRSSDVDRRWHPPLSRRGFVPPGQMAQVGRHMVRDALDLSAILDIDAEKRGYPLYHRGSMAAFRLSGDGRGLSSLHQLARDRGERVSVVHISKGSRKPALAYNMLTSLKMLPDGHQ